MGFRARGGLGGLFMLRRQAGERGPKIADLLVEAGLLRLATGNQIVQLGGLLLERVTGLLGRRGLAGNPVALGIGVGDGLGGLFMLRRQTGERGPEIADLLVEAGLLRLATGNLIAQLGDLLLERVTGVLGRRGLAGNPVAFGIGVGDGLGGLFMLRRQAGERGPKIADLLVEAGLLRLATGNLIVQLGDLLFERVIALPGSGGFGSDPVVFDIGRRRYIGLDSWTPLETCLAS